MDWGWCHQQARAKLCFSYKRTALVVCSINIVVALFVLHSLSHSLYSYSPRDPQTSVKYTEDQIKKMEESIRVRRAAEPKELVRLTKQIEDARLFRSEETAIRLPPHLKQNITDEILVVFKSLEANATVTMQRDMLENWRIKKLEEAKTYNFGKTENSAILQEEAGMLVNALESNWSLLLEEIGVWMPNEVINKEHDDKPDSDEEFETPLAGRPLPSECNVELHTDYGGDAVRWGLTHPKESAADCCQACLDQAKDAKPGEKKCNIWVYCPSETGCFSPDIYQHKHQECWLKYAKNPRANFKHRYSDSYRSSHPSAPAVVPWVSGVVSS